MRSRVIIRLAFLLFLISLVATNHALASCGIKQDAFADWVTEPASLSLCKGHYRSYDTKYPLIDDSWSLPVELSADETEYTFEGASALRGAVTFKQGLRTLHADQITVDRAQGSGEWEKLLATGNIHYFSPGLNIWGQRAEYLHSEQLFSIDETFYRWYARHARGYADHITVQKDVIHLEDATYTTCAPNQDTWILRAKKLAFYPQTGRAVVNHIRFDFHDIPIFYFPYFNYPIDNKRHSGFLFPSYGASSNSGNEVIVPYYWNVAPNYDVTFAGRWLSERGTEAQTKLRYLFPYGEGTFQWHFLPNDRKYGTFSRENLISPPGGLSKGDPRILGLDGSDSRYALNYRHTSAFGYHWQLNMIFDYVSDDNYFVDLGNDIHTASTVQLPQQANLSYYGENWTHTFNVEEYQVLQPLSKPINEEIYKRQPQWVFQAIYPDQFLNLTYGLSGETVNFAHKPNLLTRAEPTTGQRLHLRPSMSLPIQGTYYYFTPRYQLDWLQYYLHLGVDATQENLPHHPSRTIPLYDFDSGLFFERDLVYKGCQYQQTLEPRLYYLYVPYRAQYFYPNFDSGINNFSYSQLFRDNRFSGHDRISDANQISASLTSRLFPKEGGRELLRASVGQIFYFQKRHVSLCEELGQENVCHVFEDQHANSQHSDLIAQAEWNVSDYWSGGAFWQLDAVTRDTEQAAFNVQYQTENNKIINLNYYWLRHDIGQINLDTGEIGSLHQADISVFWPLNIHWQLLSRWHYNLQQRQTIEVLGGIEYSGCCVAVQLIGSRYRQSNNFFYPQAHATGVFAQIVFKGLSAIGLNNPDGKLKQKIPGYVPLRERQNWVQSAREKLFPPSDISLY